MQKLKLKNADKNSKFFIQVYDVVKRIPEGKVATYGQIAGILGTHDSRKVGYALHANKDSEVPCHRVVNKNGRLAPNFAFNGWREQRIRLLDEGVVFKDLPAQADEMHVDLEKCLWNTALAK